ncbi:hypothetical protein ACRAWC_21150 [Leifsonia sp. L25]|uniref:hypothetical protein n=1 Tax=Leifsonia sp. L25 TaxID=3423957 RepID=UPI003D681C69
MTTMLEAPTTDRRPFRLRHGAGFWVIAAAFLAVMAFSTIPTPLYALYQARDGFPPGSSPSSSPPTRSG